MKQLLTIFIVCFAFKAISQPATEVTKYWKVIKSDTAAFVRADTAIRISDTAGWVMLDWQENVEYTKERTLSGEVDTIKRQFFQYRYGKTSGYIDKRTVYLEKWLVDLPKSRAQQIMDSINQSN